LTVPGGLGSELDRASVTEHCNRKEVAAIRFRTVRREHVDLVG
jgi:hypothetical protein